MNKKKQTMERTIKGTNKQADEQTNKRSNEGQRREQGQQFPGHGEPIGGEGGAFKFVKSIN